MALTPYLDVPVIMGAEASVRYRLTAVIYFGSGHFTMQYIRFDGSVYFHDGLARHAMHHEATDVSAIELNTSHGKQAMFVVYSQAP